MLGREAQAQKHTRIARRFIDAADHYLVDGDVIQASEKLWGAASHAVKVFCIRQRWRHGKYSHLRAAMRLMVRETGDDSWIDGFKVAYENHLNFYSDDMRAEDVGGDRLIVRELIDRLLAVTGPDPRPPGA